MVESQIGVIEEPRGRRSPMVTWTDLRRTVVTRAEDAPVKINKAGAEIADNIPLISMVRSSPSPNSFVSLEMIPRDFRGFYTDRSVIGI